MCRLHFHAGIELIRKHAAQYIERRDGYPADAENIVLSGGASEGIRVSVLFVFFFYRIEFAEHAEAVH